ncbi:unnamed protein product [Lathyrus oleraceus]
MPFAWTDQHLVSRFIHLIPFLSPLSRKNKKKTLIPFSFFVHDFRRNPIPPRVPLNQCTLDISLAPKFA